MAEKIKLPLLKGFRLSGFKPIYSSDVSLKMGTGAYVVLGGNGLGKTTLMQAVIYGLAGGLDAEIEDIKSERWTHGYFRGRLSPNQLAEAKVEIDFRLGAQAISVRRGFRGSEVTAVKIGKEGWNEERAPENFARILREYGGYLEPSDFSFVVHRLLYLAENRRLIAWDTDAQLRLLMLLNQDIIIERDFRENRALMKLLDSKKRHLHVALGKAEKELATLLEYEEEVEGGEDEMIDESEFGDSSKLVENEKNLPLMVEMLNETARKRSDSERRQREATADLSRTSGEIEALREEIETAEAGLVANFLAETERDHNLALSKLINNMICPACGTRHARLGERAREYVKKHCCALCGSDDDKESNESLEGLQEDLDKLIREQQAFEEVMRLASAETVDLRNQELKIQSQVNEIRYSRSVVSMVERNLPEMTAEGLKDLKKRLIDEEADAEAQMIQLRNILEEQYIDFREKVDERLNKLKKSYNQYATAFLGLPCELEEVVQPGPLQLKLFVPSFNGTSRPVKESCSEAQRFFLDIAFRMALISSACESSGTGSFVCETPESALDLSYIRNVVEMFDSFSQQRHNILLTANIQTSGIAEKIVIRNPVLERSKHILNLLEFGRLSEVQKKSKSEFDKIIKNILTSKKTK